MKVLLQLFSLKFIAAFFGLIYSILQVHYFGATRIIEIYFAAQSLVYLVTSLTQSGQLAEVFLPEYHKLNVVKSGLGYQGLNVVLSRMLVWGGIIILCVFFLAPYFIRILVPGFSFEDRESVVLIFRALLPYLFLQIMNSFFITVLNADKKFGKAELLGLTNSLVNIILLIILYKYLNIWALVISLLLGKIIEFFFYIYNLYKNGYRFRFITTLDVFDHVSFFKTMKSTFLYVGATQIYSIALIASISFLPEGVYAIFKYVQNLTNKVRSVFIQPFLTIFFTKYSILLQSAKSVTKEFAKNSISIISVNSIIIIGTILLGDIIIDIIWGGDKFDANDVNLAYVFLLFNIVGVLIGSIGSIYRKMAVAHGLAKKLYSFWVFSQLASALLAYVLIKNYKINGLYFILLINNFLIALVSYLVYARDRKTEHLSFLNKSYLIFSILIFVALIIKYFEYHKIIIIDNYIAYSYLIVLVLILSLFPVKIIYKELKN